MDINLLASSALLSVHFKTIRNDALSLAHPLSIEDCCVQSMPDASPIKWHLAHTTWFFETFILEKFKPHYISYHPAFRMLFNSYYNGVGEKHPRAQRGLITRPSLEEVLHYRNYIDTLIVQLIEENNSPELTRLITLGLQHEQQHQELMLTDIQHLLFQNPLKPAYSTKENISQAKQGASSWIRVEGGIVSIGHTGEGFCFDNELPRHRQFLEPFSLASRLVTNGEYLEFMQAGGYSDPALWLSEGWDWIQTQQLTHPIYWQNSTAGWKQFTLQGMQTLEPQYCARHLSYFEAEAYARWAGARLPTEFEWEYAAQSNAFSLDNQHTQLFNTAWQWTSSSYAPYPGYTVADGAIGEYNGKFMVNQYVLRGGSCATPLNHTRPTYRNFFPATARWQFTGIRLAKSA